MQKYLEKRSSLFFHYANIFGYKNKSDKLWTNIQSEIETSQTSHMIIFVKSSSSEKYCIKSPTSVQWISARFLDRGDFQMSDKSSSLAAKYLKRNQNELAQIFMEDDEFNIASQLHGWKIAWMSSCSNYCRQIWTKKVQVPSGFLGIFPKIIIIKKSEFHLGTTVLVSMAA